MRRQKHKGKSVFALHYTTPAAPFRTQKQELEAYTPDQARAALKELLGTTVRISKVHFVRHCTEEQAA